MRILLFFIIIIWATENICLFASNIHIRGKQDTLSKTESFNDYLAQWKKIIYIDKPILEAKESFIIVSNREFYPDSSVLMSDFLPKKSVLKYVFCQIKDQICYITLFQNLKDILDVFKQKNDKNFLVFIHGDGRTFPRLVENSTKMVQLYPINLIAFDYPSKKMNKSPISNYYLSKKNIRNSLDQFHQFVLELEEGLINHVKTSLMSHSLGGYFIANYLKKFENHFILQQKPIFENLILMLSAVKSKNHIHWIDKPIAKKNYVLFNQKDIVLKTAEILSFSNFLGTSFGKKMDPKTNYIDITQLASIYHTPYDKIHLMQKRTILFNLFSHLFNSSTPNLSAYSDVLFNNLFVLKK